MFSTIRGVYPLAQAKARPTYMDAAGRHRSTGGLRLPLASCHRRRRSPPHLACSFEGYADGLGPGRKGPNVLGEKSQRDLGANGQSQLGGQAICLRSHVCSADQGPCVCVDHELHLASDNSFSAGELLNATS
jgi:hypothetical protein